jgi:hypothetical protein
MKKLRTIVLLLLCIGFMFNATSCVVFVKKDHGKHKGWHKSTNNPHHSNYPNNTNLGKSKGFHKR